MRYLVTSALPYANGPIHFGHVAGAYLPADIFVRFRRLRRDEVLFICGTDEHGTPITQNAKKEGTSPKAFADRWHEVIGRAFERLEIRFDNFSRTTLPHHYALTQRFFTELQASGYIVDKVGPQLFCPRCKIGLADRLVTGTCYVCQFERARGDECPRCGTALDALKVIDPCCKTCGTPAQVRDTRNWYVNIPKLYEERLEAWLTPTLARWKPNVLGEVRKLTEDLRDWVITRDLDWGVPVPLAEAKDKVFYVWFDAPIGYISSTIEWAERQGRKDAWRDWWFDRENTRLIHFIGKDNIAFHAFRWPAILIGQKDPYVLPHDIPANEFYNLEGGKFSTSEGWYIDFDQFTSAYPADTLRWTIARSAPESRDSEFTWKDFQQRVNGELLGNFGNFASRVLRFIREKIGPEVPRVTIPLPELERAALGRAQVAFDEVGGELERYGVRAAAERLLEVGDAGNKLLEQTEPWKTLKTAPERCAATLNTAVRILEMLATGLSPFCPTTAERIWRQLGLAGAVQGRSWAEAREPADPGGRALGALEHLFRRIEDDEVAREVEALRARARAKATETKEKTVDDKSKPPQRPEGAAPATGAGPATGTSPAAAAGAPPAAAKPAEGAPKPDISYDDFAKLEIKIAKVLTCVPVEGADKLYKLELEVDAGQKRLVVSGIRPYYKAEELIGREVAYLANLAPKKLRGVMSQGMILAAHSHDGGAVLLQPDKATFPGSKIS